MSVESKLKKALIVGVVSVGMFLGTAREVKAQGYRYGRDVNRTAPPIYTGLTRMPRPGGSILYKQRLPFNRELQFHTPHGNPRHYNIRWGRAGVGIPLRSVAHIPSNVSTPMIGFPMHILHNMQRGMCRIMPRMPGCPGYFNPVTRRANR